MTKFSKFNVKEEPQKEAKKTELLFVLQLDGKVEAVGSKDVHEWDHVMLFESACDDIESDMDTILAWDDDGFRAVYLGRWNDGC